MPKPQYRNNFEEEVGKKLTGWAYEPEKIPYFIHRDYIPDFKKGKYLIECKGFFRIGDTQKYKAIRDCLDGQELIFILYRPDTRVRKGPS